MLAAAAAISLSIADVLRHLGITIAGGNHAHISRQLKHFGIDTSHFSQGRPEQGAALATAPSTRTGSHRAARGQSLDQTLASSAGALIRQFGYADYRCAGCKIEGVWQGGPLTLHVDHINGDWLDNRIRKPAIPLSELPFTDREFRRKSRGAVAQRQRHTTLGVVPVRVRIPAAPQTSQESSPIDLKPIRHQRHHFKPRRILHRILPGPKARAQIEIRGDSQGNSTAARIHSSKRTMPPRSAEIGRARSGRGSRPRLHRPRTGFGASRLMIRHSAGPSGRAARSHSPRDPALFDRHHKSPFTHPEGALPAIILPEEA